MAYGISANVGAAAWNRDVFQALESWRDLILSDDAIVVRCLHAPPIPDQRAGVSIYYLAVRATSKVERFAIQGKHKPLPSAIDEGVRDANGEWMLKPTSVRKTSVKRKASASSSKSPSKDNMKIKVEEGLESNDGRMDRDNNDDMSIEQLERLAMRAEEDSVIERQSYDDELTWKEVELVVGLLVTTVANQLQDLNPQEIKPLSLSTLLPLILKILIKM